MTKFKFYQIYAIAFSMIKEFFRNRYLSIFLIVGLLMFFIAYILGNMAVGGSERILQNFGFWIIGMWGLALSVVLGSKIIKDEFQKKTIYMILSRPVNREIFILGKFSGMVFLMTLLFVIFSSAWLLQLFIADIPITFNHLISLLFIFFEWILLAVFSMFFACFTSPLLHSLFLIAIYFVGHSIKSLYVFAQNSDTIFLKSGLLLIYYAFPNLEAINFRTFALYKENISMTLIFQGLTVSISWTVTVLFASILIFTYKKVI